MKTFQVWIEKIMEYSGNFEKTIIEWNYQRFVNETQNCIVCSTKTREVKVDLIFILDMSGSIQNKTVNQLKEKLIETSHYFDVVSGKARIALVWFGSKCWSKFIIFFGIFSGKTNTTNREQLKSLA